MPFYAYQLPNMLRFMLIRVTKLKIEFTRNDLLLGGQSVRFDFGPLPK